MDTHVREFSSIMPLPRSDNTLEREPGHRSMSLHHESPGSNHSGISDILEISRATDTSIPADRYRWVLIGACATIAWWFTGTTYSWGVIQGALVEQHLAASSTLAFVGSLTVACIAIFALVNAKIVRILGMRTSGLLGITLLSIGEICSGFTTKSVVGMFFATGVIMGMGTRYSILNTTS